MPRSRCHHLCLQGRSFFFVFSTGVDLRQDSGQPSSVCSGVISLPDTTALCHNFLSLIHYQKLSVHWPLCQLRGRIPCCSFPLEENCHSRMPMLQILPGITVQIQLSSNTQRSVMHKETQIDVFFWFFVTGKDSSSQLCVFYAILFLKSLKSPFWPQLLFKYSRQTMPKGQSLDKVPNWCDPKLFCQREGHFQQIMGC